MTATLETRVADLEAAVLELTASRELEFVGDLPGHPFHGNQHTENAGARARDAADNAAGDRRTAASLGPRPAPKNGVPQMRPRAEREPSLGAARGPKATAVNLRDFDHDGPTNGLPLRDDLKTGGAVIFDRSFGHPAPTPSYGLWAMKHDGSGTRVSGTGNLGEVKAAIREQFPKSGDWTILP